MTTVYVLRNQDDRYFDKHGEWTDGADSNSLYRTPHKDEALNQKLELTVRHPDLRITLVSSQLDDKGRPRLSPSSPEPLSRPGCDSNEPDTEPGSEIGTEAGAEGDLNPLSLPQDITGEFA